MFYEYLENLPGRGEGIADAKRRRIYGGTLMKTSGRKAQDRRSIEQDGRLPAGMHLVPKKEIEEATKQGVGFFRASRQWGEDACAALVAEGHKMPLYGEDRKLEEIASALYGKLIV